MTGATIFVPCVGQGDNIGDVILRRQLLTWLRPLGQLHVYVGGVPDGFIEALDIRPDEKVYRSFSRFYSAALRSEGSGRPVYVFKPGEVQLTLAGMKEHVSVLPIAALTRLRGGAVARIGAGTRDYAPIPRALMWPSNRLSQLTYWRDGGTSGYLGGHVMPDLAFGEGATSFDGVRDSVTVSMRGDRPMPSNEWVRGLRSFATDRGFRLVVVTQVEVDRERSGAIAQLLDAELVDWAGESHAEQEARVRLEYRRSAVTVSDRMHVLIAALTEGASPIGLLVNKVDKIERHFAAAGMSGVGIASADFSAARIEESLERALANRDEVLDRLAGAREELEEVRVKLEELILGTAARPLVVTDR